MVEDKQSASNIEHKMHLDQHKITQFLQQYFPQSTQKCSIDHIAAHQVVVNYRVDDSDLRPGGTVSGPAMMTVADYAMYVAILSRIGLHALAVTTNLNINFLRKPTAGKNLKAECRLLKVGKHLVVGEVTVYSVGNAEAVAHVTATYSLPPQK